MSHEHEGCGCSHDHQDGESCGCGGGCGGHGHHSHDKVGIFVLGPLENNCYLYISGKEAMVVDPTCSADELYKHFPQDLTIKYIVGTHGHGDHVGGVKRLKELTGAQFALHPADAEIASHAGEPGALGNSYDDNAPEPDVLLTEGKVLEVGTARFRVLETPGHTPGCVCLLGEETAEHILFVGDVLFKGSCGRTDFPGGSPEQMANSLARLKIEINPHTNIFSGHGDTTTMEDELKTNPYLID